MSQAGGPNSAGSVNIDFTGNVAPLEQAAKKAEAVVQESAQKMQAAAKGASGAAGGATPYMPGENYGPMYNPAEDSPASTRGGGRFAGLIRGAKSVLGPMNAVMQIVSRVSIYLTILAAAGYGVVRMFHRKEEAARASSRALRQYEKDLKSSLKAFDDGSEPTDEKVRIESLKEIDRIRIESDEKAYESMKKGEMSYRDYQNFRKSAAESIAKARDDVDKKYDEARKKRDSDAVVNQVRLNSKILKSKEDIAQAEADAIGGWMGAVLEAESKKRIAKDEETNKEILDNRLKVIDLELAQKIEAIAKEKREQTKRNLDSAKQVGAEIGNIVEMISKKQTESLEKQRDLAKSTYEFWRDIRGNQASGFAVEGFQTSNLSQSLDLLARQRGGVDGPKEMRIDYGGTR